MDYDHKRTRVIHFTAALIMACIFVYSGIHMKILFGQESGPANIGVHMLYRANHVHLLTATLVNFLVIGHFPVPAVRWQYLLQRLCSLAILIGSAVLVVAFFNEPQVMSLKRLYSVGGLLAITSGTLILLLANLKTRAN